jgi:hypothetical protein
MKIYNGLKSRFFPKNYKNPSAKVFYLHIPKCGGSSITDSISNLYHPMYRASIEPAPAKEAAGFLDIDRPKQTESLLT